MSRPRILSRRNRTGSSSFTPSTYGPWKDRVSSYTLTLVQGFRACRATFCVFVPDPNPTRPVRSDSFSVTLFPWSTFQRYSSTVKWESFWTLQSKTWDSEGCPGFRSHRIESTSPRENGVSRETLFLYGAHWRSHSFTGVDYVGQSLDRRRRCFSFRSSGSFMNLGDDPPDIQPHRTDFPSNLYGRFPHFTYTGDWVV